MCPRVENRLWEPNFWWFFFFEVRYLQNHRSDFDDFFCKVMTIQFSFQIKKETVRKIETFEKNLKFSSFDRFWFFRLSTLFKNNFRLGILSWSFDSSYFLLLLFHFFHRISCSFSFLPVFYVKIFKLNYFLSLTFIFIYLILKSW